MNSIEYVNGDATCPQGSGTKIICHVCNDIGGWGKGFVLAVSKRWKEPETAYRAWHGGGEKEGFRLGASQFVQVEAQLWVGNLIAQRGIKPQGSEPPIRYDALAACLQQVAAKARDMGATVHMPRIGCGLAGGKWEIIEPLIEQHLLNAGIPVTVYDLT